MIKIDNVTKIYENGAIGVKEMNLEIEQGEFVFVVGTSGSGKSTFMRMLLKEVDPTTGNIYVDGQDITALKRREIPLFRRKIGVVFQDFRLLPSKTVYENVAFAMQVVEASPKAIRRTVPQVLSMVGLHKKAKAYPNQLSGGEQQRVCIARALINHPEIVLADEPTGNLDEANENIVLDIFKQLHREGTTLIVVTHDPEVAEEAQRTVVLEHGRLVKEIINENFKED